ncbi:MAG: hypothetical protein ABSC53_00100 [Bacteroidota bacterium]
MNRWKTPFAWSVITQCDRFTSQSNRRVRRAAAISSTPIINAGDGKGGQHPTQALLDLYTIYKEIKTINGVKVALVGNLLDGRTVRSFAYLLGKYERVKIYFVAPPTLQMKQDILDYLNRQNVWYTLESDFKKILPEGDVVYMTRIEEQKLSAASIEGPFKRYFIDEEVMKLMGSNSILMHPLPRLNEISPIVDTDSRAVYFRQTKNGVLIRMALLVSVLD